MHLFYIVTKFTGDQCCQEGLVYNRDYKELLIKPVSTYQNICKPQSCTNELFEIKRFLIKFKDRIMFMIKSTRLLSPINKKGQNSSDLINWPLVLGLAVDFYKHRWQLTIAGVVLQINALYQGKQVILNKD